MLQAGRSHVKYSSGPPPTRRRTQIWIANSVYALAVIVKKREFAAERSAWMSWANGQRSKTTRIGSVHLSTRLELGRYCFQRKVLIRRSD
jgi:hypothetical protein